MKLILLILTIFLSNHYTAIAQWTIKHLDENSDNSGTVKFKNDSLGLFMGGSSSILKTKNTGETWKSIQINFNIHINDFQFIGDSAIFAVSDNKLIKSENLGENWDSISNFTGKQLHSLWFFNNDSGLVAGYDGIYRTDNKGSYWDTVWSITQFGYKYGELRQIVFPTSDIGYAIGIGRNQSNNPGFDNFLLKSNDSGATWDTIKTFLNSSLTSLKFINQNIGFIGTESGLLFKTYDAGNTWSEIQIATSWNTVKSIQFLSKEVGFAAGGSIFYLTAGDRSNFFISKTVDGGESWSGYDTLGIALTSVHFINDTTGFVSGDYELIMKSKGLINKLPQDYPWHLVQSMDIDENRISNSGIKVYPNPVSEILHIQDVHSNTKIEKMSLLNTSGQLVEIKKNGSDNGIVKIKLIDLVSGIYFLKIEYQDKAEVIKIIKQ